MSEPKRGQRTVSRSPLEGAKLERCAAMMGRNIKTHIARIIPARPSLKLEAKPVSSRSESVFVPRGTPAVVVLFGPSGA